MLVALFGPLVVVIMALLLLGAGALERWAQTVEAPADPGSLPELGEIGS